MENITARQWIHLVMTRSGNVQRFYVDCRLVDTDSTTITSIPNYGLGPKARIGTRENNTLFFNGKIDDVRIYNRALSEV